MSRRKQYRPVRLQDDDDDDNADDNDITNAKRLKENIIDYVGDKHQQPTLNGNSNNGDANNNGTDNNHKKNNEYNKDVALKELAMLQSTFFSLQHQQVLQLQLIQQLQSQLGQNEPPSNFNNLLIDYKTPPNVIQPVPTIGIKQLSELQEQPKEREKIPEKPRTESEVPAVKEEAKPLNLHVENQNSTSLASSIIINDDVEFPSSINSLEMLQRTAQEVLDSASQGLLSGNLADELIMDKSCIEGRNKNDPFFKHRCRYCGKIFGSDSALQIHLRSHTGERPFICNVCNSKFTTKGNLKVHYQRHTMMSFSPIQLRPPEHFLMHNNYPQMQQEAMINESRMRECDSPADLRTNKVIIKETEADDEVTYPEQEQLEENETESRYRPSGSRSVEPLSKVEKIFEDKERPKSVDCKVSTDNLGQFKEIFKCSFCSQGFIQMTDLLAHIENIHQNYADSSDNESVSDYRSSDTALDLTPRRKDSLEMDVSDTNNYLLKSIDFGESGKSRTTDSKCQICCKIFPCHSALEIHLRSHTKERPFKCNICEKGFTTKSSGNEANDHECTCSNATAPPFTNFPTIQEMNLGNLKQHIGTHKNAQHQSMSTSSSSTLSPSLSPNIKEEMSKSPEPEEMEDISKPHFLNNDLTSLNHLSNLSSQITAQNFPHEMPKQFESMTNLFDQCNKFKPESSASLSSVAINNQKHYCVICRKNFSSSSALQIHTRTHTGDKPFRCHVCQKAFTTKGNLKVHMGTHMWTNTASRRGRRMSLEIPLNRPLPLSPQDTEFLQRRPDLFYPYIPGPFINGMPQKLPDIGPPIGPPRLLMPPGQQPNLMAKFGMISGMHGLMPPQIPGSPSPSANSPLLPGLTKPIKSPPEEDGNVSLPNSSTESLAV